MILIRELVCIKFVYLLSYKHISTTTITTTTTTTTTTIIQCSHHGRAVARVLSVHVMNTAQCQLA